MVAALVGLLGVVVGLAVGFGYRFWSTRRDELMAATIAATLLRDAIRATQDDSGDLDVLIALWEEQRVNLIRLITPADYELLAHNIATRSQSDPDVSTVFDGLAILFWREHQAFILTPLFKYLRRDDLSDKASAIISKLE